MLTTLFATLLSASLSHADKLNVEIQAKDISVKSEITFRPGTPVTISGTDVSGKRYDIDVMPKLMKDGLVRFECDLNHDGEKKSVAVVTKKGLPGLVISGPKDGPPDLKLNAIWSE